MSDRISAVEYYYATVGNEPGEGRRLLEHLSEKGVNLLAFTAFPVDGGRTQLDFVPAEVKRLQAAAQDAGIELTGPKHAFLLQGNDRVGALHQHHLTLANAGINVHAANGVVDGTGRFGYVLWVSPEEFGNAAAVLGLS